MRYGDGAGFFVDRLPRPGHKNLDLKNTHVSVPAMRVSDKRGKIDLGLTGADGVAR